MPRPVHHLRQEFEAALAAHLAAHGPDFERSALVQGYVDRGVSQASVYRWVSAVLAKYEAGFGSNLGRIIAPIGDAAGVKPPVETGIVQMLPVIPTIDDVRTKGLLPVVELLSRCISVAGDLIKHAQTSDGAVRNSRLLLHASEHLRRSVETATKINETVGIQQEINLFHDAVMEEIAKEPRDIQERVLMRVRRMCEAALAG